MGYSRTRARTHVPCIGRRILNHCATREAPDVPSSCTSVLGTGYSPRQHVPFSERSTCKNIILDNLPHNVPPSDFCIGTLVLWMNRTQVYTFFHLVAPCLSSDYCPVSLSCPLPQANPPNAFCASSRGCFQILPVLEALLRIPPRWYSPKLSSLSQLWFDQQKTELLLSCAPSALFP